MIDFTPEMTDVISTIGDRSATATEMGVNGYTMRRLSDLGFLRVDLPRFGEYPPTYSLSEKGQGAAAVLTCPMIPRDCEGRVRHIKRIVAEHYQIPLDEMVSARRSRSVARPRQVAMYLSKSLTPKSLPDIGKHFGGRDHTTVIHAVRTVTTLMDEDDRFKNEIETLKSRLVSDSCAPIVDNSHLDAFAAFPAGA